ncbi:MAG: RdgB/HAM1 family non-canonical purine NTP pyrophosphatase [Francisellaceae bacterium]
MKKTKKILFASSNKGKIEEVRQILIPLGYEIIPQSELDVPDVDETGLSFIENAILKARHCAAITGLPSLADDSGLAVAALDGAPGIYSARYAGNHGDHAANIAKLLTEMETIPDGRRQASFECLMVYIRHENDPLPMIAHGSWQGEILRAAKGNRGFGYDPVFYVPEFKCSAAELDSSAKNNISHRALALRQLQRLLKFA